MGAYDENLYENVFFQAFNEHQSSLLQNAIKKKWIITIPKEGSFHKNKYYDMDYLSHILVPVVDENSEKQNVSKLNQEKIFKTLGNQKVSIRGKSLILYSKEDDSKREIQILFSETFYEGENSYQVICINESLTSKPSNDKKSNEFDRIFSLDSVDECSNFLWKFIAKPNTKTKVDEMITLSRSKIQTLDPVNLDTCFLVMRDLFVATYNLITSHKTYSRVASRNENIQSSLKLALEMYICHNLSSTLFWALTDVTSQRDAEVNIATRRFQHICASKSGIRFDVCENMPRARKELASIRYSTTPIGISECLRKVIAELSYLRRPSIVVQATSDNDTQLMDNQVSLRKTIMVTSDDLLSSLIFLIIKSDIPNWFTYLEFGVKFRFAACSRDDEYQYYLTTLEAALEHIRGMPMAEQAVAQHESIIENTRDTDDSLFDKNMRSTNHWTRVLESGTLSNDDSAAASSRLGSAAAYQLKQTKHLFQLIESGQTAAVKEMLERIIATTSTNMSVPISRPTIGPSNFHTSLEPKQTASKHHCHPLCACTRKVGLGVTQSLVEVFRKSESNIPVHVVGSKTFDESVTSQNSSLDLNTPIGSISSDRKGKKLILDNKSINLENSAQETIFIRIPVDDKGWSALHVAAWSGNLEILKLILDSMSNFGSSSSPSILATSSPSSSASSTTTLISPVELNMCTIETGDTALHLAVRQGHQDVCHRLLDVGASQIIKNVAGQTPLHLAAELGFETCVSTLIYFGVRQCDVILNAQNSIGNTALHIAAIWGYAEIASMLLEAKASPVITNNKGQRPYEIASTRSLIRLLKIRALQIEKTMKSSTSSKSDSSSPKSVTNTLLNNKMRNNGHQITKPISNNSGACNNVNKKSRQRLEKWSNKQNSSIYDVKTKTLMSKNNTLQNDVQLQQQLERKIEKLLKVVADGDLQMLQFLLEIRDDSESSETSPIDMQRQLCHPLCQCHLCAPVQNLIIKTNSQLLNVNSVNKEGFHSLHISAIHDRSTIAKFLLKYGADPNLATHKLKLHPLHLAAIYDSVKVLSILLSRSDVNKNITDQKLNTPLFYACSKGKYDSAKSLIQAGVNIDTTNNRGNTPLHEAVRTNHTDIVNLIIESYPDLIGTLLNKPNGKGLTPLDLARDVNLFFKLKKLVKTNQLTQCSTNDGCFQINDFVSINTESFLRDFENDNASVCSDSSALSSGDQNEDLESTISDRPLFEDDDHIQSNVNNDVLCPTDPYYRINQPISYEQHIDNSLLERIDFNSNKYNYRLTFRDPNSPSVSSTCSSTTHNNQ